jgi:hypothetical protein
MSDLLPAEKKQVPLKSVPRRKPFEKFNRPKWDDLCADFREDLSFKFFLVSRSDISGFAGKKANSTTLTKYSQQVSML